MTDAIEATHDLELTRHLTAPPQRVFAAWTGVEWAEWMPPQKATCRLEVHEARVGGRFQTNMIMADGRVVRTSGTYRVIDPPHRLVFTWVADYADFETVMEIDFVPEGTGTRLTLRQSGFPGVESRDGYAQGWGGPGGSFDKLDALLSA